MLGMEKNDVRHDFNDTYILSKIDNEGGTGENITHLNFSTGLYFVQFEIKIFCKNLNILGGKN